VTTQDEKEYFPEIWTYGGIREFNGGRRHLWYTPEGKGLYYKGTGHYVTGGLYNVEARREDGHTFMRTGTYTGERVDAARCLELSVAEQAALTRIATLRRERKDGAEDAITEALAPLVRIARTMSTNADRDALVARIIREFRTIW